MSRSYKHTPRCGEIKHRTMKKSANRRVRRSKLKEEYPQYGGYRKRTEWWDICDYETVGMTFEQFFVGEIDSWYRWQYKYGDPFPTREEAWKEYVKQYIRK